MPKKDTATAVLGMLSSAGAQTRTAAPVDPAPAVVATVVATDLQPLPTQVDAKPTASVSALPPAAAPSRVAADEAPRTLRLRAATARQLRAAWLEAKRDDVLLTAQDFASTLVEEALAARHRRARTATSG